MPKSEAKAKHTPGPWEINVGEVYSISTREMVAWAGKTARRGTTVDFGFEHEANLRLIKSAPALLEALENLVSVCEGTGRQPPCIENAKTAKPSSPPSESRGRRVAFWCGC